MPGIKAERVNAKGEPSGTGAGMSDKMQRQQLSVIIVTFNEEAFIEECLRSVVWADEIIVVDGHSTDRTVEIARRYTDHVVIRPNEINPEINKNFGIAQATGDWILCLDADERVEGVLREEIQQVLSRAPAVAGYWIPRKNYVFNQWMRHSRLYPDFQLRLFRSGQGFYPSCTVHEPLTVTGPPAYLHGHIIHVGTLRSFSHWMEKANDYTTVEAIARIAHAPPPPSFHAVVRPLSRFITSYVVWRGFRDGWLGLWWSVLAAFYEFMVILKTWELRRSEEE